MISNAKLIPQFQKLHTLRSSLSCNLHASLVDKNQLSVKEYFSWPLYDKKTGLCFLKEDIEKWFTDYFFYHMDNESLTLFDQTKPTLSAEQLELLTGNEEIAEWYTQYAKLWVQYHFAHCQDPTIKLMYVQPSIDDFLRSHCSEKCFTDHYTQIFRCVLLIRMPQYKKYLDNASTFRDTVRSVLTSEEYIHKYSEMFDNAKTIEERSATLNELRTKLDLIDPESKLSSEIPFNYVSYTVFRMMCIRPSAEQNKNFISNLVTKLISQVLVGIASNPDRIYRSFYNNITKEFTGENPQNELRDKLVSVVAPMIGREAMYKAKSNAIYDTLVTEIMFVLKKPEIGIPAKFVANHNLIRICATLSICALGMVFYSLIQNYNDIVESKLEFQESYFFTNCYAYFNDVEDAGPKGYIYVSECLQASTYKINTIINTLSTGLPALISNFIIAGTAPSITQLIPTLYLATLDSYLWNFNNGNQDLEELWSEIVKHIDLEVGLLAANYSNAMSNSVLFGPAFIVSTLARSLKLKDGLDSTAMTSYLSSGVVNTEEEPYFLTPEELTERLALYTQTNTFDEMITGTDSLLFGITPELLSLIRKNIDPTTKSDLNTKFGFNF
eukprot:gene2552-3158_t